MRNGGKGAGKGVVGEAFGGKIGGGSGKGLAGGRDFAEIMGEQFFQLAVVLIGGQQSGRKMAFDKRLRGGIRMAASDAEGPAGENIEKFGIVGAGEMDIDLAALQEAGQRRAITDEFRSVFRQRRMLPVAADDFETPLMLFGQIAETLKGLDTENAIDEIVGDEFDQTLSSAFEATFDLAFGVGEQVLSMRQGGGEVLAIQQAAADRVEIEGGDVLVDLAKGRQRLNIVAGNTDFGVIVGIAKRLGAEGVIMRSRRDIVKPDVLGRIDVSGRGDARRRSALKPLMMANMRGHCQLGAQNVQGESVGNGFAFVERLKQAAIGFGELFEGKAGYFENSGMTAATGKGLAEMDGDFFMTVGHGQQDSETPRRGKRRGRRHGEHKIGMRSGLGRTHNGAGLIGLGKRGGFLADLGDFVEEGSPAGLDGKITVMLEPINGNIKAPVAVFAVQKAVVENTFVEADIAVMDLAAAMGALDSQAVERRVAFEIVAGGRYFVGLRFEQDRKG